MKKLLFLTIIGSLTISTTAFAKKYCSFTNSQNFTHGNRIHFNASAYADCRGAGGVVTSVEPESVHNQWYREASTPKKGRGLRK